MASRYSLEYARGAETYVRRLPPAAQRRITTRLAALCVDPYDRALSKPLRGELDNTRSSRVGEWRILYRVLDARLVVLVVRVGPRGDVYRG